MQTIQLPVGAHIEIRIVAAEEKVVTGRTATIVEAKPPAPRKRGGKRKATTRKPRSTAATGKALKPRKYKVQVPLSECLAVGVYPKRDGSEHFPVAVYRTGVKNGRPWYLLLYINAETEEAYHPKGGFFAGFNDDGTCKYIEVT